MDGAGAGDGLEGADLGESFSGGQRREVADKVLGKGSAKETVPSFPLWRGCRRLG